MVAKTPLPTKYVGPEPGKVTDKDAERVRRSVPDDPIKVKNSRACEGCGVQVKGPSVLAVPVGAGGRLVVEYGRCPDCQRLHDLAAGDETTRHVLYALAVIGIEPPDDPSPLLPWMHALSSRVAWLVPESPQREWVNPYPWAHVSLGHRAKIREAYLLAIRDRIRTSAPALHLPPPWSVACLFCGIGTVPMAPLEVARRGGRENAAHKVWRGVIAQPKAFGGRGPDMIDGFVCPPCSEALDSVGSVNRGCARAFERYAQSKGIRVPSDLGDYYANGHPVVIPGWASLGTTRPNTEPWAHIVVDEDAL